MEEKIYIEETRTCGEDNELLNSWIIWKHIKQYIYVHMLSYIYLEDLKFFINSLDYNLYVYIWFWTL